MHMLMKAPSGGCSSSTWTWCRTTPRAGISEKGASDDAIWAVTRPQGVQSRRSTGGEGVPGDLYLRKGEYPLRFRVNGNAGNSRTGTPQKPRVLPLGGIPRRWLKKGKNTVEMFCRGAEGRRGLENHDRRQDEFEAGGGNPADVGKTSFKSTDGGESWKESPFGPLATSERSTPRASVWTAR